MNNVNGVTVDSGDIVKDAKKKANRIAQLKCRQKKHWEQEIKKLNGKEQFKPEKVLVCMNTSFNLVTNMNKHIQWKKMVQLSRPGTVTFYANSQKPMERAVIVRTPESYPQQFPIEAIEASRIQNKNPPQKIHRRGFQSEGSLVLPMTGPVSGGDGKYYILIQYINWNKEIWWVPAEEVKELAPAGGKKKTLPIDSILVKRMNQMTDRANVRN